MLIYARFIVVIYFGIVYSYIFSSQNMLIYSYEKKDYHAFTMTRIENMVTFIQEKKSLLVIDSVCIIYMGVFIYVTMTNYPVNLFILVFRNLNEKRNTCIFPTSCQLILFFYIFFFTKNID